jgi:pyruvate dehydrogenase E2 component (dihydrolipoamide acetyltransferase)
MSEQISVIIPTEIVNDKEVTIVEWLKENATETQEGEVIAIVETSKMNVEIVSPASGFLKHLCEFGDDIAVGAEIAYIESVLSTASNEPQDKAEENIESLLESSPVRFSKKAKKLMIEHQINPALFSSMSVVKESDVYVFLQDGNQVRLKEKPVPVRPVQKTEQLNGKKPSRAKRTEIDNLRAGQDQSVKSFITTLVPFSQPPIIERYLLDNRLSILIFETAKLLQQFKEFNAYYSSGFLCEHDSINIAFAIDADFGLKTLTVANADQKSFGEIQADVEALINRYLENELNSEDFRQASFTITDLSSQDVFCFDPLLSQKQSAILGIGASYNIPGHDLAIATFVLSFDHQVTEGKRASEFLAELKKRYLGHIMSYGEKEMLEKEVHCGSCYRSLQDLKALKAKLLSHYLTPSKTELICSICLNGW